MKKFALVLTCCLGLFCLTASAHTKSPHHSLPVNIIDSAEYTGKYQYVGLPFEYMEISIREGKLYYSGGEYNGFLTAIKDTKDAFDANGEAVFTFVRNDQNKIFYLKIDYQGQTYTGKREEKKN